MQQVITAKSKTFLIGEYCILFGGSAIVLTTSPEFELIVKENEEKIVGINENSPAFSFYVKHKNVFKNLSIEFIDPHKGSGGLGASSAQFTMLYKLFLSLSRGNLEINSFLAEYKSLAGRASGADCVSQIYNHHVYFNSQNNAVENIEWNFKDIDFAIFKTGLKTSTHLHLSQLSNVIDVSELSEYVENARLAFINKDSNCLVSSVNSFFSSLKKLGFTLDQINKIVENFLKTEGVLAAKGCGAMCSDTILIIFNPEHKANLLRCVDAMHITNSKLIFS